MTMQADSTVNNRSSPNLSLLTPGLVQASQEVATIPQGVRPGGTVYLLENRVPA